MLKFISFLQTQKSHDPTKYTLLMLNGYNSCLNLSTMYTAAANQIICLIVPSNLTNAWQANDSGVNKTFKENLSKVVTPHIEAKLSFSSSDLSCIILKAFHHREYVKINQNFTCTHWICPSGLGENWENGMKWTAEYEPSWWQPLTWDSSLP